MRQRVNVEPQPERSPREGLTIDDKVVSWLSQPAFAPLPKSDAVASCTSCGFEGLIQYGPERGDTICPACLAVCSARPERPREHVDCPNCNRAIEIREIDRGRTIVCPDCHYFLGCMFPPEKRRFAAFPFLNVLLGGAKD